MEGARAATRADLPAVAALAALQHEELAPMRGGSLWAATHRVARPTPDDLAPLLRDAGVRVLVGTFDEQVVGFAVLALERLRTGEVLATIQELFVEPRARTVGVGEAIMNELLNVAAAEGCVGVDAQSLPGHRATKNFFEGQGFTARSLTMHRSLGTDASP